MVCADEKPEKRRLNSNFHVAGAAPLHCRSSTTPTPSSLLCRIDSRQTIVTPESEGKRTLLIAENMGGSVSTRVPVVKDIMPGASVEDIARVVMPLYYTQEPITPEEYEAANTAWKLITRNQCQAFFDAKAADPR